MISIACDHGAYALKELVKAHLVDRGLEVRDFGTDSTASCDYADFCIPAAKARGRKLFVEAVRLFGTFDNCHSLPQRVYSNGNDQTEGGHDAT